MNLRLTITPLLLAGLLLGLSCSDDGDSSPEPTPPTATSPAASPTPTSPSTSTGLPAAPTQVRISGALPDLRTPVPPGQGEQGRITVEWQDNSNNETGFRIVQECQARIEPLAEVTADETRYGPLQTCRPGRVGVASFNANGASQYAWAP